MVYLVSNVAIELMLKKWKPYINKIVDCPEVETHRVVILTYGYSLVWIDEPPRVRTWILKQKSQELDSIQLSPLDLV